MKMMHSWNICIAATLLFVVATAPWFSRAQPSWTYVTNAIDNDSDVTDCIFLAGNNATGPAYTHAKGTAIKSTSQRISVASGSKWPAAAIIYRLVEEGKLSLDDLASTYLSYWTKSTGDPRYSVTLRQLLAFTGGFKDDDVCCGDNTYTLQSCAQQIYDNATGSNFNGPSGSTFYYGCNNLQVAGAVAEKASGVSWNQLFNTYWKEPLGITSVLTVWTPAPSNNPNIAGGLFCSTDEYLKWLLAMFENTYFANKNTLSLMLADETTTGNVTIGYSPLAIMTPRQVWHYCQGHWLECEQNPFSSQCYPLNVHSSPGKFGFYPRIDFANRYWSIVARMDTVSLFAYTNSVKMFQKIESNVTALLSQPAATTTSAAVSQTGTTKKSTATITTKASATTTKKGSSSSSSSSSTQQSSGSNGQSTEASNSGGGCYAASSLVRVLSPAGGIFTKSLGDLRAGEFVESWDQETMQPVFERVYFVAHGRSTALVELLELSFAPEEKQAVAVTANHLLLVATSLHAQPSYVQAGSVHIGDLLYATLPGNNASTFVATPVTSIRKVLDQVRNPLTYNDRIVVSGVAGSVFVHSQAFYSAITTPIKLLIRTFPESITHSTSFIWFLDQLVAFSDSWEALALPIFTCGFSSISSSF